MKVTDVKLLLCNFEDINCNILNNETEKGLFYCPHIMCNSTWRVQCPPGW